MVTRKLKQIFIITATMLFMTDGQAQLFTKKFKLPDAEIAGKTICGGSCLPGNFGSVLPLYKKTYEPELNENYNEKLIAYQILGRTYSESDLSGSKAWTCSENLSNPFSIEDVIRLGNTGASGTSFDYKRKEKLNLDINAAVQTNLDEIKANNPSLEAIKLNEFGAKLTAAYSKFNGKDLTIEGKYSQWGIKRDVVEAIVKDVDYKDCKKFLAQHNYRIILSIGMVYFDISYGENSLDKIAADLEVEAKAYGIKGNVSVSFKREVSKDLKKVTKGYYQILVWRTAGVNQLKL